MRESGAKTPARWCSNRVQMGLGWRFLQHSFRHQVDSALHSLDALQETSREMMNYSLLTKLFTRVQPQDEAFLLNELLKHQVLLQDHTLYRAVVLRADGASFRSEATDLMLFKLKKAEGSCNGQFLPAYTASWCKTIRIWSPACSPCGAMPSLCSINPSKSFNRTLKRGSASAISLHDGHQLSHGQPAKSPGRLPAGSLLHGSAAHLGLGKWILPSMCASQLSISGSQIKSAIEDIMQGHSAPGG